MNIYRQKLEALLKVRILQIQIVYIRLASTLQFKNAFDTSICHIFSDLLPSSGSWGSV